MISTNYVQKRWNKRGSLPQRITSNGLQFNIHLHNIIRFSRVAHNSHKSHLLAIVYSRRLKWAAVCEPSVSISSFWNVAMTSMHPKKRLKMYEKRSAPCVMRQCANNNNNNNDNDRRSSLIYNAWVMSEIEKKSKRTWDISLSSAF